MRRRPLFWLIVLFAAIFFGGSTLLSYYVDALWFTSLGYREVFWKTLTLQGAVFSLFAAVTFTALFGGFLLMEPAELGPGGSGNFMMVNGRPVRIPVGPVLRFLAFGLAAVVSLATGAAMAADWPTFALWWYGRPSSATLAGADRAFDPIFGKPIGFYLFTLPAWQDIAGWLTTLALVLLVIGVAVGGDFRAPAGW